jgi:nitroimidazol reductase NimA-like FMN-containing flavoprotein (pyridoxamine 5'-phosphate oxidase superfamily)
MKTQDQEATVRALDQETCLRLLATQRLGRLAVVAEPGRGPHVVPVNYTLLRGSIVLRSAPGTKLTHHVGGHRVQLDAGVFEHLLMGWISRVFSWTIFVR